MAIDANKARVKFVDRFVVGRPTASARAGTSAAITCRTRERSVPALFFTTQLHPDYHTPRDEPERIDIRS